MEKFPVHDGHKILTSYPKNRIRESVKSSSRVFFDVFVVMTLIFSVFVWTFMLFNIEQVAKFASEHPRIFLSGLGAILVYLIGLICVLPSYLSYREFSHHSASASIRKQATRNACTFNI